MQPLPSRTLRRLVRRPREERLFAMVGVAGAISSTLALANAGWGAFISALILTGAIMFGVWNWNRSGRKFTNSRIVGASLCAGVSATFFVLFVLSEVPYRLPVLSSLSPSALEFRLPEYVRIAQGQEDSHFGYAWMYLEPTFTSAANTTIEDMRLEVSPLEPGDDHEPLQFEWGDISAFDYDPETQEHNWRFVSRPVPLSIGADQSLTLWVSLNGPDGWYFEADTYAMTFDVEIKNKGWTTVGEFEVTLDQDSIDYVNEARGGRYLPFDLVVK